MKIFLRIKFAIYLLEIFLIMLPPKSFIISLAAPQFVEIAFKPDALASKKGIPKPSLNDNCTYRSDFSNT